ncbi:MAG: type III pantothenate kinase [Pedobacter sp.]|nr:type III pantothenate kinase [Pedobacter sp.]
MNLCVDQGNTSTKAGVFNNSELIDTFVFHADLTNEIKHLKSRYKIEHVIYSTVIEAETSLIDVLKSGCSNFIFLSHETPVPVEIRYGTPETLGKDRLAAIVGAAYLKPHTDLLVIDAGTAVTYDFIDAEGRYFGGNIAPGVHMRARALHEFTGKLPLISPDEVSDFLGNDTRTAIAGGVVYGVALEIDGYIDRLLLKYPKLFTFLTGGSSFYFDNKLKNRIFADKNLVLTGLNRILQYNVF